MIKSRKLIALLATTLVASSLFVGCNSKTKDSSKKVLNVYNVGDYIDESLLKKFEDKTGIKVNYETYDTNEIMYQKLKGGNSSYDIVVPSDYMVEKMIKENMLEKIDFSSIENYKNIDNRFKNLSYDPKNEYSVPYMWGTYGILYNKKLVKDPVDSWDILWNEKYKGQIFMLESIRDSMGVALKKLGYSLNTTKDDEINKAKEALTKQKPLVLAYVNDEVKDRMVQEEAALAVVYSGDAVTMKQKNANLEYVIPKEGSNKWFDTLCIPKGAKHKEEAEKFIDFLLDPEVSKQNTEYIGYSTPNKAALDLLDDKVKNDKTAYPSDDVLNKCEVFVDLGDILKKYDDAWLQVKSK